MDFCPCKAAAEVCNSQVPPFGAAVIFCRGDLHGNDQTIARPPWDVQIAPRNPEAWPIVLRDRPLVERFKAVPGRNVRVLPDFAPLGAEARAVGELFDFQSYHLPKYFCTIVPNSPRIELFRILLDRVFNRTQSQWTSTCIKSHRIVRLTGING